MSHSFEILMQNIFLECTSQKGSVMAWIFPRAQRFLHFELNMDDLIFHRLLSLFFNSSIDIQPNTRERLIHNNRHRTQI